MLVQCKLSSYLFEIHIHIEARDIRSKFNKSLDQSF